MRDWVARWRLNSTEEDAGPELKAFSFVSLNSLICAVDLSPSFFFTRNCAVHRMLWCVSKSDTSPGTSHGCILELDPVRTMGQEPATASVSKSLSLLPSLPLFCVALAEENVPLWQFHLAPLEPYKSSHGIWVLSCCCQVGLIIAAFLYSVHYASVLLFSLARILAVSYSARSHPYFFKKCLYSVSRVNLLLL